jgi:O-antigen ligase
LLVIGGALLIISAPFSNALTEISSVLVLWGLLLAAWRRSWNIPDILLALIIAWLAACAISAAGSTDPALSWRALVRKTGPYAWLALAGAQLGRTRHGERLLVWLAWVGVVVAVEAWLQGVVGHDPIRGRLPHGERLTGPFNSPNNLATFLLIVMPLQLWMVMQRPRNRQAAGWAVALALETIILARADSRSVWVALGAAVIVLLTVRRSATRLGVGICSLVAGIWAWYAMAAGGTEGWHLDPGRAEGWNIAWRMFRDHPVDGIGLGTYMEQYMRYPQLEGQWPRPQYAHNCYLQILAEGGAIGLATFLAMVGWVGAVVVARLRQRGPMGSRLLPGLAAALAALLLNIGIDTVLYSLPLASLWWFLLGLAAGLAMSSADRTGAPSARVAPC